jgi:hypothetical protein
MTMGTWTRRSFGVGTLAALLVFAAHADTVPAFFVKNVDCDGIPVRSSAAVEDVALRLACSKITVMLKSLPAVKTRLIRAGVEMHVIGRDENTSDLPEFRGQKGVTYIDNTGKPTTIDVRTRGMGGRLTSCGEENLLRLPTDRYAGGSDTCIHEFAHAIMDFGMTEQQRDQIRDQYANAMSQGRWRKAYAATNAKEYWAELSMWYFGFHGDRRMEGTPPDDGPRGLRAYDPDGYALLDRLYHE